MKTMILSLAALFLSCTHAHADTSPRLSKGDWIVAGSTTLQFYTNSPAFYSLSPEGQYFVADKTAVGAAADFAAYGSNSSFSISPEVTFHTVSGPSVVPYLTLKPFEVISYSGGTTRFSSAGRIGIKFFITDSVAFGPAFEGRHYWPKNGGNGNNSATFYGVFSMHI